MEEFLKESFGRIYSGTDDDMPDRYEEWLSRFDDSDWITMANLYAKDQYLKGKEEVIKKLS